MELIRNKFTTYIKGRDNTLKLPTEKFDDIIGILDNKFPVFDGKEPCDIFDAPRGYFDFKKDGETINMQDLLEYADLDFKLYSRIISKASIHCETDETLKNFTYIFIHNILCKIFGINNPIMDFISSTSNRDCETGSEDSFSTIYRTLKEKTFYNQIEQVIRYNRNSVTLYAMFDEKISNNSPTYSQIIIWYKTRIIPDYPVFIDNNKNIYSFPTVTYEEIEEIVKQIYKDEIIANSSLSSMINDSWKLNLGKLIINTETWKKCRSGLLTLINQDGQKELVSISNLMLLNIHEEMQKNRMECMKIVPSLERITFQKTGKWSH